MITSRKGKEMLLTVSPIYFQNKVMMAIFQAIGLEADTADELADDVSEQLFVQTATWGLDYWEEAVAIPTNKSETFETRRSNILIKMQTRYPVTPNRIKRIVETITKQKVDIIQNVADYTFLVSFGSADVININFLETLDEIKPAHLSYRVESRVERIIKIMSKCDMGYSLLPLCNMIEASVWPYQQNVGKFNYSEITGIRSDIANEVLYPETAKIEASEKLYKDYQFATQATHASSINKELDYYENDVEYVKANEIASGIYPYVIIEGKVIDTGVTIQHSHKNGKTVYPETALVTSSEDIYNEYKFAKQLTNISRLTAELDYNEKDVEYIKANEVISGEYPRVILEGKIIDIGIATQRDNKSGSTIYPETALITSADENYNNYRFATQATSKTTTASNIEYREEDVDYIRTNEVISGEYPYVLVEGKILNAKVNTDKNKKSGFVLYPGVAQTLASENIYDEYKFAETTDFEFGLTSKHHVSLKELEWKKPGEIVSGKHPYTKTEMMQIRSEFIKTENNRNNKTIYKVCGSARAKGDKHDR